MTAGVVTAHLDDVPTLPFGTDAEPDWKPLRHRLGVGAFGVNAWVAAKAGDPAVERHDEAPSEGEGPGHEELYVVLRGAARFTVDGQEIDAPAGTLVFVSDPALTREATATADDTIVLAIGAARGVVFEPSAWEGGWLRKLGAA
jgi:hypothetical protein